MNLGSRINPSCELKEDKVGLLLFQGLWRFKHFGIDGELKDEWSLKNLVVNQGLSYFLQTGITGEDAKPANWQISLIAGATPTIAPADTMASKAWTEEQQYSEATRQAYAPAAEAAQKVTNTATPAIFTVNANGVIIGGAFMVESAIKGSTSASDVLLLENTFPARTLNIGELLNITVELTAADA